MDERQGKDAVRRERMLWAEKIAREETVRLKEFEREKKTISENHAKGVAKLVSSENKRTKATEIMYSQHFAKVMTYPIDRKSVG